MDLLRLHRWRFVHSRPARTEHGWRTALEGDAGWFDFAAMRGGRLLLIEAKSGRGRLSAEQMAWRAEALLVPCAEYYVWGREDLEGGTVERVLR